MWRRKYLAKILTLAACLAWVLSTKAAVVTGASSIPEKLIDPTGPTDPAEVEAFMDGFWQENMAPLEVPGAVFVLVKGDQILFSKGYGVSDIEQGKAVNPGETLFAIGSVSKAVTASAVMQLTERGLLRLDEPVNRYLKSFQIGESCSPPVTTSHLLTHTAGFDERVIGGFAPAVEQLTSLAEFEARDLPPCVRPPGQEMSYCNHCYGVAGLLVQEITNQPFEEFVEENIFKPLEMLHSSFRQPLPAELESQRATGYIFTPETQPAPQLYLNNYPSGGMWASGEDMGRYIIAQLQGGLSGGKQVFNQETRTQMHERQFSQDARLEGWTFGFFENFENGERIIEKGGDVPGFSSVLYLMPEHELGMFLSYNATAGTGTVDPRQIFPGYFLGHYFPASETPEATKPTAGTQGNAVRLAGTYRWARFGHTSIDKAISPMSIVQWRINANPDGSLTLAYPSMLGGQTSQWVEVEPGLFQNLAVGNYLTFAQDSRGRASHIYTKIGEEGVLESVAWYETLPTQAGVLILMGGIFILAVIVTLVALIRRGRAAKQAQEMSKAEPGFNPTVQPAPGKLARLAPWLAGILAALNLFFLAGLALTVAQSLTTRAPALPAYFVGMLVIPLITGILALLLLVGTVLVWKDRTGSLAGRVYLSLVTLAGLAFTWFAWYWNLLGFRL
jgi:CubicO group peptidase (beta-lactamase class C family)